MKETRAITDKTRALREREQKRRNKKRIIISLIVFVVVVLLVFLFSRSFWNVQVIEVQGASLIKKEKIEAAVRNHISGYKLFIFAKANILFMSSAEIETFLQKEFPRIDTVQVSKRSLHMISVTLTERTGMYLWCGDVPRELASSNEPCQFIDDSGVLFSEAPYFSGPVHFVIFGRKVSTDIIKPVLGTSLFTEDDIDSFMLIEKELEKHNLKAYGIFITPDETRILLSRSLASEKNIIRLNARVPLDKALRNLFSALEVEKLKTQMAKEPDQLEYLDLRFTNKVYFKFTDQTVVTHEE
jgi:predicted nucleic acid-binding Zn ribbon protein/L-rhamnose mutarotase